MKWSFIITLVTAVVSINSVLAQDTNQDTIVAKEIITPKYTDEELNTTRLSVDGKIYQALITLEGDTLILADLDDVSITSFRTFESDEEYKKYMRFRRYAVKVFPYAKEAIRIYREWEYASQYFSRRERKRKMRALEEELTKEFEDPLKKLTKLQGKIMVKMIEKETGKSMHRVIKDVKGGFKAFYWNHFSKLYGYELKEGYNKGDYKILDAVLDDFDVSHRIENETNLKYITIDKLRKRAK
jgi:hypothetical protein